jgi:HAE1 family hydrophobic/amphiphilic exporter-1
MEKAKRVEQQNIDPELEYDLQKSRELHKLAQE